MNRTITALFDTRQQAEKARERLLSKQLGLNPGEIDILDQGADGETTREASDGDGKGFFSSLKNLFLPDDDRSTYEEGIRRGNSLLTVRTDEQRTDKVVRELDGLDAIDIDSRSQEWEQSGWQRQSGDAEMRMQSDDHTLGMANSGSDSEERIPIVEEELRIGKREVARGGARVRSYAVETPVHEQVSLREERASIERRPVNEAVADADGLFQDRDIEVTEMAEEAVVGKEARVREELVVRKETREHVEDIDDTVRHTEVEVDDHLAASQRHPPRNLDDSGRRPRR